jgi:hypothetical protein
LNEYFIAKGHTPAHRLKWVWNAKDMPDTYLDFAKIVHSRYIDFLSLANSRWWLNDSTIVGPKQSAEWWRTFGEVEDSWQVAPSTDIPAS